MYFLKDPCASGVGIAKIRIGHNGATSAIEIALLEARLTLIMSLTPKSIRCPSSGRYSGEEAFYSTRVHQIRSASNSADEREAPLAGIHCLFS